MSLLSSQMDSCSESISKKTSKVKENQEKETHAKVSDTGVNAKQNNACNNHHRTLCT